MQEINCLTDVLIYHNQLRFPQDYLLLATIETGQGAAVGRALFHLNAKLQWKGNWHDGALLELRVRWQTVSQWE